jgi:hypothetical protein
MPQQRPKLLLSGWKGTIHKDVFDRSVVIYEKIDRRPQYIRAYHGCYDPLAYPIYNPRGET